MAASDGEAYGIDSIPSPEPRLGGYWAIVLLTLLLREFAPGRDVADGVPLVNPVGPTSVPELR